MPRVKITDSNLREIMTSEFSRVPCVGEVINLDEDYQGREDSHKVEYVSWSVYRNNNSPVEAMISLDIEDKDGELAAFFNKSNEILENE